MRTKKDRSPGEIPGTVVRLEEMDTLYFNYNTKANYSVNLEIPRVCVECCSVSMKSSWACGKFRVREVL